MGGVVYSCLQGRLGNLLFEIGAGLSYAYKYGKEYKIINGNALRGYPRLLKKFETSIVPSAGTLNHAFNDSFEEHEKTGIPEFEGNVLLRGYYQCEKYLDKDLIRSNFNQTDKNRLKILEKYQSIQDGVGIHVRLTDFFNRRNTYNVLSADYYNDMYNTYFSGKPCFIASDDLSWCRMSLKIPGAIYIDEDAETTLFALSLCKDHIMSSSTYSWWAAWLAERYDSVNITPRSWFREGSYEADYMLPDRWVKIDLKDNYIVK